MSIIRKTASIKLATGIRLCAICFFVLFSQQGLKAQDVQNQTVETGQTTKLIPLPAGGCGYTWEVIDNPQIGFTATSGNGDIPAFTAINNTNKSITAHIRVTPSAEGFAYIPNNTSNNVTVLNTATNSIATHINVDSKPYGVAASPDGRYIYVVNTRDEYGRATNGLVSVIDAGSNAVVGTYTVGDNAAAIAVNPNGKWAYVVNEKSNSVSVLDLANYNTVMVSISINAAFGIGVSPDGSRLYVSTTAGQLYVIDTSSNLILDHIPISSNYPPALVVSPDGAKVYISNIGVNYMCVIDVATRSEQKVQVGGMSPFAIAITPKGDKLYASTSSGISILNTADNSIKKTIPLTGQRYGVSISPNGKQVFVVEQNPDQLEVINTTTDELETPIPNDMPGALSVGNFVTAGIGCSTVPITYSVKVNALPHIDDPGGIVVQSTHYGTASAGTVLDISGSSLQGPITVTAPVGFEISTDDITFKNAVTIGSAGDVPVTEVFVRLKATAPAKAYHANIELSSPGATSVEVPVESTVLTTQLNITADNKIKFFGDPVPALTATYTGFVNGDGLAQLNALPYLTTTATASSPLGEYPITVNGGSASNYKIVTVPGKLQIVTGDVSVSNAFTPNGDGINDTWDIKNLNLYANCTVEVVNRYGQKVYYANGYPAPWNGTLNGQDLPVGTYYYIIKLKPGSKPLTGPINIIR